MNSNIIVDIVHNIALLMLMAFVLDLALPKMRSDRTIIYRIFMGIALGLIGIAVMFSPWEFSKGIVFDTRSILLGVSGLFFGIIPTTIAMFITAAYRLYSSGSGGFTGVSVILASGTIGILWRHIRKKSLINTSIKELYLFGLVIHIVMLLLMFTLPPEVRYLVLSSISIPVIVIYPLGTSLLGSIMLTRLRDEQLMSNLRESEERFYNAFEYAPSGMALVSIDGHCLKVNQTICNLLGYSQNELLAIKYHDLIHPDDLLEALANNRKMIAGEISNYQSQKRYFNKSGEVVWVFVSVSMVRDEQDKPLYFILQIQDITETIHMEQDKRQFYRETIMSATQGKLNLVSNEEVETYLKMSERSIFVASPSDTMVARHEIRDYCVLKGLEGDRLDLFETAVGEALTNAIKHAQKGQVNFGSKANTIWVAISDNGQGISTLAIPSATLRKGCSSKISMGLGYSIMLEASDNILLSTGPQGTTVVLLAENNVCDTFSLDELPDTWGQISDEELKTK